jgi:transcription elongation factor S-II
MSKLEADVCLLKISLEKRCDGDATASEIEDILKALMDVTMSIDILRKTKIGKSVSDVMKKYSKDTSTGALADTIVSAWKAVAAADKMKEKKDATSSSSSAPSSSSAAAAAEKKEMSGSATEAKLNSNRVPIPIKVKKPTDSFDRTNSSDAQNYDHMDPLRKKIMGIFADRLQDQCMNSEVSNFLAYTMEASVHKIHHSDHDRAAYTAKARSLAFNLKQNEQLRLDIADGTVPADALVLFSQAQLATANKREEFKAAALQAENERRTDYNTVMREQRCKDLGIDPDASGGFRCSKCGSEKTTHYQMQTRSADEPMTVFICCLKCGKRWKE